MKKCIYKLTMLLSLTIGSVFISCNDSQGAKHDNLALTKEQEAQEMLAYYVFTSDTNTINDLIKQGANVNIKSDFQGEKVNIYPLEAAALARQTKTIETLLNAKADKKVKTVLGNMLHSAVALSKKAIEETIDNLIKKVNTLKVEKHKAKLIQALTSAKNTIDDKGAINALIKAGVDKNAKNNAEETPLDWAKELNKNGSHKDIIEALEASGAK